MQAAPDAPRLRGHGLELSAGVLAFATYFCMYAFRKPFTAASYDEGGWFGLDLKTTLVVSQVLDYAASKFLGIKWVSEVTRRGRLRMLLGLVLIAELSLVAFGLLPRPAKAAALFCNGLPLGMVWGLVVRYLEGRRSSDMLLAALSCSFIVASGAVKDVAGWVLRQDVPTYWMPAVTGLVFLAPFCAAAWLLDRTPEPNARDVALRSSRPPMFAADRRLFWRQFAPGLLLLLCVYLGLTAFRDYRDNYGLELFSELGYPRDAALFTRTELPVAVLVLLLLAASNFVRGRVPRLLAMFALMTAGMALPGAATLLRSRGWISGQSWMICLGLGAYLAYVPFSSFLFDRIMAATRFAGTAVFAVNLADAVGYTGSVGILLLEDLCAHDSSRLAFVDDWSYVLGASGCVGLCLASGYFWRQARQRPSDVLRVPQV